jgi:hypothetical protein
MSMYHVMRICVLFLAVISWQFSWSQSVPASDPQAVMLANAALAALTGGATIQDVTLTGSVVSGIDSGTATLKAMPVGESRMDLSLSGGTRSELRDEQTGVQLGQWMNPDGTSGYYAPQNCWTDPSWFFPAFGYLAGGPNVVLSYIGMETHNGQSVQHIKTYLYAPSPFGPQTSQYLSVTDFYLDSTTLVPMAIAYSVHPDNDASTDLPVEIDFESYQTVAGIAVPGHIQRYQQGALMFDITVTGAVFNSGLSLSGFAIN